MLCLSLCIGRCSYCLVSWELAMQCYGLCHRLLCSGKPANDCTYCAICFILLSFSSVIPSSSFLFSPSFPPFLSPPHLMFSPHLLSLFIFFLFSFPSSSSSSFPSSSLRCSMAWALSCIGVAHFYRLVTDFGGYHLDFTGYYTYNETLFVFW